MKKLHFGVRWQFRFAFYFLSLIVLIALIPLIVSFVTTITSLQIILLVIGFLILVGVLSETYVRMAYNRWLYEFVGDCLKIENGVIWKKYSNIPYNRVQNVDIRMGVLARMLGFSAVHIQTAGASYGVMSEGFLPAVDVAEAEKIREFLMKKVAKRSSPGL